VVVPPDRPASLQRLEQLARAAELAETSRQPYRVLLVEDNHLVAAMYTSALRRLAEKDGFSGLQIEHAPDASEALARLARDPTVDVVITDVYMPGMSGFALLETLRADPRHRALPVVVISSGTKREQEDAARLGAQYFLRKPVKYQEIVAVVRTLLTAAAHRAQAART
jgi:CheY-like chemotaxis protein